LISLISNKIKKPVNQLFTGFLLPFVGLSAEKEELSISLLFIGFIGVFRA
tara:strand:+ start:3964 stop:4113 length:150 start_codon:yes stop_codon:yes gene_type:complete